MRNVKVTLHTAGSVLPEKSLDFMMSIYTDDAVLTDTAHDNTVYSGKAEVREQHLHFLRISTRLLVGVSSGYATNHISGVLVDAASDLAVQGVRTAVRLHRASRAVKLPCPVNDRVGLGDVGALDLKWAPVATQSMPPRASVFVGSFITLEVAAGLRVIRALRLIPQRHMRH